MHEIEEEVAIKLGNSGWWKDKTHEEIVRFQLFTAQLCMPFGEFHGAVEKCLGRPVFTHEFGLNVEGMQKECRRSSSGSKRRRPSRKSWKS